MKTDGVRSARGTIAAIVLVVAGLALAWLCFRTAVGQLLPPTSAVALAVEPRDGDAVLDKAVAGLVQAGEPLDARTFELVRQQAAERPLDARPYLILSQRALAAGDRSRAVSLLEAGQRLDPRERLIHILLLDRYLRDGDIGKSAQQFSVLSRLVNEANSPIAQALVLMAGDPNTLPAVRRTLAQDSELESKVLVTLARGDAEPSRIFDLASPAAIAQAGVSGNWGPELVGRLVQKGRFGEAREIWQRIYGVPDQAATTPIFNPRFQTVTASAPFNWTFAAGSLGVADPKQEGLFVEYYGRDTGDLAKQTILLKPGRYRFVFAAEGTKADTESRLFWQIVCASDGAKTLLNASVTPLPDGRTVANSFAIPAGCPAQTLRLFGQAGEFPDEVNTTIRNLAIRPLSGSQPASGS